MPQTNTSPTLILSNVVMPKVLSVLGLLSKKLLYPYHSTTSAISQSNHSHPSFTHRILTSAKG
jgi:hypothetical protein